MASQDMLAAADGLESSPEPEAETSPPDLETIRGQQDAALDKLAQALAILEPPQPESQPQEDPQDQEQQPEESPSQGAPEPSKPEEEENSRDPNQLLQSVRDREAERHRRKQNDDPRGYDPVEKDW